MNKKNLFLGLIILLCIGSLFVYQQLRMQDNDSIKFDIRKKTNENKNPISINIKNGDILTNNFKIVGNNLGNEAFLPKYGKIARVILKDLNNKILGKTYLYKESREYKNNRNIYFFSTKLTYNKTKEKEGVLEIISIPQNNSFSSNVYKIKVFLDNEPVNLNEGFTPKDGSVFVASPNYSPFDMSKNKQ